MGIGLDLTKAVIRLIAGPKRSEKGWTAGTGQSKVKGHKDGWWPGGDKERGGRK